MQPIPLSSITTEQQLLQAAENWYARLGRLKLWLAANPSHPKRGKVCNMAARMAVRILPVAQAYLNISKAGAGELLNKRDKRARGGIVQERGPEMIHFPLSGSSIPKPASTEALIPYWHMDEVKHILLTK